MKIFEIQLKDRKGEVVYKSLVPEVHVQEKVDTLISMNKVGEIGAIHFIPMGDISDRYIQTFIHDFRSKKKES